MAPTCQLSSRPGLEVLREGGGIHRRRTRSQDHLSAQVLKRTAQSAPCRLGMDQALDCGNFTVCQITPETFNQQTHVPRRQAAEALIQTPSVLGILELSFRCPGRRRWFCMPLIKPMCAPLLNPGYIQRPRPQ